MLTFIIVVAVIFLLVIAFAIGAAVSDYGSFLDPDSCNGWAIRWLKYSICGAFCGHEWKTDSMSKEQRCERCGKTRRVRP